jgi:hypothetical protein
VVNISVNDNTYPVRKVSLNLNTSEQDFVIRKGRLELSYHLSHSNTSKVVCTLKKDDGNLKIVHTYYLKGKGVQKVDALMFDTIVIDEHFEIANVDVSFSGYNFLKNE